MTKHKPCEVCGSPAGIETYVHATVGSRTDLTGEIGYISGFSVGGMRILCSQPECRTKAEEQLRGAKGEKHTEVK